MVQTKGVKMNGAGTTWPASCGSAGIEPENGTGRRRPLPTSMDESGTWGVALKPPGPPLRSSNNCTIANNSSSCNHSEVPLSVEEGGGEGCKQKAQQQAKKHRAMQKVGRPVEVKRNDSETKNVTGVRKVGDGGIKKGSTGGEKGADDGDQPREAIDPFTLAMVASILQCVSHGPKTEPELRTQLILDLERCRSRIPSLADKFDSCGNVAQHMHIQGELLEVRLIIDMLQALGLVRSEFVEVSYGGGPKDLHPEPISKAPNCTCRRIMKVASLMLGVHFAPAVPTGSKTSNRASGGRQKLLPGSSSPPLSTSGYSKPTVEIGGSLEPSSSLTSPRQPFPPPPTRGGIRNNLEAQEYVQSLHAIVLGQGAFRLLQSVEDRSAAYAAWLAIDPYTVCHDGTSNSKNSNIEGQDDANKATSGEGVEFGRQQLSSPPQPNNSSVTELPIAVKRLAEEGMFDHIRALYGDTVCDNASIYLARLLDAAPIDSGAFRIIIQEGLSNREVVKATYGEAVLDTLVLWVQHRIIDENGHPKKKTGSGSGRGRNVGGGGVFRKSKSVVPQAHEFLHPKMKTAGGNDSTSSTVTATVPGKRVVRFRLDPAQDRVLTDWKAPSAQLAKLDDEAARLALCEELLLRQLLSRVGMHLPVGYLRVHCIDALRSHKPHAYSEGKRSAPAIKRAISMGFNAAGVGGAGLRGSTHMVGGTPSLSYGGIGGNSVQQRPVHFPFTLEDIGMPSHEVTTSPTTTKKEVIGVKGEESGTMTDSSVGLNSCKSSPTTTALSSAESPPSTVRKDSKEVDSTLGIKKLPRRTAAQLWDAVRSNPPFLHIQTHHKDMWQLGSGGESGLLGAIPSAGKMGECETPGGLGLYSPPTPSHRKRRLSSSNPYSVPDNPDVPPLRCGFQQQYKRVDGFRRRASSASSTSRGSSNVRDWDDDRGSSHSTRDQEIDRSMPKWRSASEDAAVRTKPIPWSLVCSMLTDITDEGTPVSTPRGSGASVSTIGGGCHDDNKDGKKLDKDEQRSSNLSYQQKHSSKAHLLQGEKRTTSPPPSQIIHAPMFWRLAESELLERTPLGKGEDHEDTSDEAYQKRHSASLDIMKVKFAATKKARSTASAAIRPVKKRSKSGSWFKSKNPPPPA